MSPRQVVIFTEWLTPGGIERVLALLANGLVEAGVEVDLVAPRWECPFAETLDPRVHRVDLGSRRMLTALPGLVRHLRRCQPAALLSAHDHANLVALWAVAIGRARSRTAISIHNVLAEQTSSEPWRARLTAPLLARAFLPWADRVIAVSDPVAEAFCQFTRIPRARVGVIHNPVIPPELPIAARAPTDDPWFAAGERPVIVSAGRLVAQKNFGLLLRAFATVRAGRAVRLVILGEGPLRADLEREVRDLGLGAEVRLPGHVANPWSLMSRAAMFVSSSKFEGLPTAVIEALACGVPVVATDGAGGTREALSGGRFGRLVPSDDPAALAAAMIATLEEPRATPPRASWEPFTAERAVAEYRRVLFE